MFFSKEFKRLDNEITNSKSPHDEEDEVTINIKSNCDEQIFSSYNFDNKTSINSELSNYIWDNAKLAPLYKSYKLQIYCKENIDEKDVKLALQSHYRREYIELKDEFNKTRFFSFACLLLGVLSILSLIVLINLSAHYIITTIMEIVAWVFVWESVDSFFLKSSNQKRTLIRLMRLYSAKIIIKTNAIDNNNNNSQIGVINEN
ncbi:MAG: hypothetical protein J6J23_03825 [Clostridia bacterium]|nr:hypothetical protein [Clostridia bacterium]